MEIRIGIHQSPRELTIETDASTDEIRKIIDKAFSSEAEPLLKLTDNKEREYLVPVSKITYVEFGGAESRKVGFVS
jgi:adenine C2-methylase RlmN of 23S rRNA A2503 and tRNA A37